MADDSVIPTDSRGESLPPATLRGLSAVSSRTDCSAMALTGVILQSPTPPSECWCRWG